MSGSAHVINPFKPGAGRVPPVLAGRDALLAGIERTLAETLETAEGARPVVVSGLRGVGKTVLLNEVARRAIETGRWSVVKLEASRQRSLQQGVVRQLHSTLRGTVSLGTAVAEKFRRALGAFRSFQISVDPSGTYNFGFDVAPTAGVADSGDLERDLEDLLREVGLAFREIGQGLLIAIDELQEAPKDDLNAVNLALHALGQESWPVPVFFIGTGLPSLPSVLADATSYAERLYDYRRLDLLTDAETRFALTDPSERAGVEWADDALDLAVESIQGYPYFAQACGKHVWDARSVEDRIDAESAAAGVLRARDEVDQGLYQSRWDRATPKQRELMQAMAVDDGRPSAIQDLVTRTGKTRTSDLSVSRNELIKNGHVYAPDRGYLAFTVPGMADFIHRTVRA
ncbi:MULTISPECIES: ATP-binding protein [unclassified Curtobacterium]|uniref:ATP-binding protein n=1 Tax=unclassified Curtobacterium TaxID=257496 RepID=UPI000D91D898|nr:MULTISPECIES: ATP-binding protein [unclassified Curtobacterium]PYY35677.1 ATP-binding protein [Curtobacterium sp. MCPF17_046]PYY46119.1 ATP-binding protein [Curtobacterium sp. MCBD17_023]WIB15737.1 ATP-binding protein [Curtobacterium sp. MCPF17_050]